MGSDPEARQDATVGSELLVDKSEDGKVKKLLFLGPGGSGKSS